MKQKSRSVQRQIFKYYAALIALTILAFSLYEFFYVFNNMKETAYQEIKSITQLQSNAIDTQISVMDTAATNLVFTQSAQHFLALHIGSETSEATDSQILGASQDLTSQLSSYVAPSYAVYEAIIHNYHDVSLTSRTSFYKKIELADIDWYDNVMAKRGYAYITPPYAGNDPDKSTDIITSEDLISLFRCAFNVYNQNIGMVEVRQYAHVFFGSLESMEQTDHYDILVFDAEESLVYPYQTTPEFTASNRSFLENLPDNAPTLTLDYEEDGKGYVLCAYRSHDSQYTVVAAIPQATIYETPLRYGLFVLAIATLLLVCLLLISLYLSQRLTAPLSVLEKRFTHSGAVADLIALTPYQPSGITEIDSLGNAYNHMNTALQQSINDLMLSQQQQLQFKMLALQSQMNPHFLHNCLANIAAMAEDGDTTHIAYMCKNLSGMLRYVVSDSPEHVAISQEITFARQYIAAMQLRFGDALQCTFAVEPELYGCKIPKMSIQPLIENSIKASKSVPQPWQISIAGGERGAGWQISVTDNGSGFSAESQAALQQKIAQIDESGLLPELAIDGMGLLNVYIRLRLLYSHNTIFEIENLPQGGSKITIGTKEQRT